MATYAQLQAESWWGREIVTPEIDWLGDELCRRTGRLRAAAGSKGDNAHLRGAHRSQEWIERSRYCTNRSYTVQSGLTAAQKRHIAGFDFTPGAWGTSRNRALMREQTRRLVTAMKAGRLPGVREVIGTLDGRTVVGTRADGSTFSSDSSHLEHWHLTLDRRRCADRSLMERILAIVLDDPTEDDMAYSEAQLQAFPWQYNGRGMPGVPEGHSTLWVLGTIHSTTQALLRAQAGDSADQIVAEIRAQGEQTRAALASVGQAILAELPDGDGPVSREDLEAALRTVLGSVDGATPAGG